MGWFVLLGLFTMSLAALWLFGVRQGMLTAAASALLVGGAGYALQGRPTLAGATADANADVQTQSLTEARHAFYGNFSPEEHWLIMSEALARDGKTEDAVGILQNAVGRYPTAAQLWVGLGNALVEHAHGLTPPAELAYQRAAALTPGYPGPRFFYDLARARSGQEEAAFRDLVALAREHPDASWRPMVAQLALAIALNGRSPREKPAG